MTIANGRLSDRSGLVLDFVRTYRRQRQIAPTYREIGAACDISTTSLVKYHLDKLEAAGYIERLRGAARGIIVKPTVEATAQPEPEPEAEPETHPVEPEAEPPETLLTEGVGYADNH